jgi:predicted transcriptional regulator/DNA-binding XRE family transcriptional regulator
MTSTVKSLDQAIAHTGTRIRERRMLMGGKQADLARSVGISPAYLNLIEHNRRRIGGKLLVDLARELGVDVTSLSQGGDAPLLEGVQDAAARGNQAVAGADVQQAEMERAGEFVGRFPGWAALVVQQRDQIAALDRRIEALNDRLSHDPFLSASLHEVLSTVTAIRSTAGILNTGDDIDPEWRVRFHRNMYEDSQRLADGAQALVQYLDKVGEADDAEHAPLDELEAWVAAPDAVNTPEETAQLSSLAAQDAALRWQTRALQDEALMPTVMVEQVLREIGPDPSVLAARSGGRLSAAMRRMATVAPTMTSANGKQGASYPTLGLLSCDGSGALTFRKPIDGFAPPRLGGACPLWPLYQALLRPGLPLRRVIEQSGTTPRAYLAYAHAEPVSLGGFDGPEVVEATMLFVALDEVSQFAPGAVPLNGVSKIEVGTSCRVCVRDTCAARREPSLMKTEQNEVG